MPRPCSICVSPYRAEVDEVLAAPAVSLRAIVKRFPQFGRTSVRNHTQHHPTALDSRQRRAAALGKTTAARTKRAARPAAVGLRAVESAQDVVDDLQRLRLEAFGLFEEAKARGDWKSAERIFAQVVAVVDRFGEMHRVLGSKGVTLNVDRSTKVLNVLGTLSEDDLRALLARAESGDPVVLEAASA